MINIEDYFEFHENDSIVVGCSAGPDSMALIDMLLKIRKKYNLSLIVAHINHNVRKESYEEAEYMKQYCEENDLVFETMVIENYGDDNFHNEAHNIRYHFFESLVYKYHSNYLMTAHHGDDLIETILMRMVRGSNLKGYSGFKEIVDMGDYKIVRPLIHFTKEELKDYDLNNNIKYYVDASNEKDKYTRNRYRKYVLPFLKEEDENVHQKFYKFSKTLEEVNHYIEKEKNKALKKVLDGETVMIDAFKEQDPFMQKEILYTLLNEFYNDDLILLNDKHIDLILKTINSKKANVFVNLPNDVIASKFYNTMCFKRVSELICGYEIEFDQYATLPNGHLIESIPEEDNNSNYICRLDSNEITLPLIVRTRKLGDKMKIKGLNGSKKIKDIFIDSKIPIDERDSWPIVVDSKGNVVWIPGIKKSIFDKNKNENYDIILKYS
ncbi:MAG: tRNA lysidine(34) synthetase TilS [Bacilli bacterium]|nr:tRNA lysidine(34) synthetase TilS [Bacilli bacterium]